MEKIISNIFQQNAGSTDVLEQSDDTVLEIADDGGSGDGDVEDAIQCTKLRRIKDRMWVREALEDITAAEFACSLASVTSYDAFDNNYSNNNDNDSNDDDDTNESGLRAIISPKKKRAVDFENLLVELDRRVEEMCVRTTYDDASTNGLVCYPLDHTLSSDIKPNPNTECWNLKDNVGMGSVTYTRDQRDALIGRILEARENLLIIMDGSVPSKNTNIDEIREQLNADGTSSSATITHNKKQQQQSSAEPLLYVRDDGSVDWDGALQDRAALKKIGTAVWARINGQDPESIVEDEEDETTASSNNEHSNKKPITAEIMETDAIRSLKTKLDILSGEVDKLDAEHIALLSSAVEAGSAVANVNFATIDPSIRFRIRASAATLELKQYEVSIQTLNYELERIYTYLNTDLGNTSAKGYIPLSDRLNVAEFGLLESQIENLNRQIAEGDDVDSEVVSVLLDQTNDFKRRLGIDYSITGLTFDKEGFEIFWSECVQSASEGLAFYGKGLQLLVNDIAFSSSLIGKALTGYTLKPREVRTLRRTFKDFLTFIPFVIILIIPLSPVGHVLVFGAIQKFFPDFFPSGFTERRQNLLALYETAEFKGITIDENWREKIYRVVSAIAYTIGDKLIRIKETVTNEAVTENSDQ